MRNNKKTKRKLSSIFSSNKRKLIAILIISLIAGTGSLQVWRSSAATYDTSYDVFVTTTSKGCYLAGRNWDSTASKCKGAPCRDATDVYKSKVGSDGISRGYCEGHLWITTNVAGCINTYHRYYVTELGCARRADRADVTNASQCIFPYPKYLSNDAGDKCIMPTPDLYSAAYDDGLHDRINLSRTNQGLKPLQKSTGCLRDYAKASAKRMAIDSKLTHASNLKELLAKCGEINVVGENIASGSTVTYNAWYASPVHRANILNPRFTQGAVVSYINAYGQVFTASWFGGPK